MKPTGDAPWLREESVAGTPPLALGVDVEVGEHVVGERREADDAALRLRHRELLLAEQPRADVGAVLLVRVQHRQERETREGRAEGVRFASASAGLQRRTSIADDSRLGP